VLSAGGRAVERLECWNEILHLFRRHDVLVFGFGNTPTDAALVLRIHRLRTTTGRIAKRMARIERHDASRRSSDTQSMPRSRRTIGESVDGSTPRPSPERRAAEELEKYAECSVM
jgi:NADPH-dependent glutamate synthase beta subunit-like oxidoreductase